MSEPATVLFGGTFDPPHLGHLAVVRGLRSELGLPVLVIPCGIPPHRPPPKAGGWDRARLSRIAVEELGDPQVSVSNLEVERPGPSFTADTLALLRRSSRSPLWLALGADAAVGLPSWDRPREVLEGARVILFDRTGASESAQGALAKLRLEGWPVPGARVVDIPAPAVSASQIRRQLAAGEERPEGLSEAVAVAIRELGLYRSGEGRAQVGVA